jgi:hypothetical protein
MNIVVARYCENLEWLNHFKNRNKIIIYDKSLGGSRDRLFLENGYSSPDGPDIGRILPGAIPLPNIGGEAHTYLTHITQNYYNLADYTFFTQGNPLDHVERINIPVKINKFYQFGPDWICDSKGRPHHPNGFNELKEMYEIFFDVIPQKIEWRPWALFIVNKSLIESIPLHIWLNALKLCTTKLHNCAMERIWYKLWSQGIS